MLSKNLVVKSKISKENSVSQQERERAPVLAPTATVSLKSDTVAVGSASNGIK